VSVNFHLLACCAPGYIVLDEHNHAQPPVISSDQFGSLPLTRVSVCQGIMVFLHKAMMKFGIIGDVAPVSEEEKPVRDPPIGGIP
jgi:hypothetical protein